MRYRADITAGSLKVPESRAVAELLLCNADPAQWHEAIQEKNVLQTRNPATARRLLQLIRDRLELMQPPLWRLVRDGSMEVATHAVFAAAVKHSPLFNTVHDPTFCADQSCRRSAFYTCFETLFLFGRMLILFKFYAKLPTQEFNSFFPWNIWIR